MKFLFPAADGDHPILRPVKVTHTLCVIPCTNQVKHVTTIVTIGARSVSKTYTDWLSYVPKQLPVSYFATKHTILQNKQHWVFMHQNDTSIVHTLDIMNTSTLSALTLLTFAVPMYCRAR